MTTLIFPYIEKPHTVFGQITRPVIEISLYSQRFDRWLKINDVLADTGADLSLVPLPIGQILVSNVEQGIPISLGGIVVVDFSTNAFVHYVSAQLGDKHFDMPLAIATSSTIPPIFGRRGALERFVARFVSGEELIIEM